MTTPRVQPGQTWADADPRSAGRTLRVDTVHTDGHYAQCTVLTVGRNVSETQIGHTTRIRLDRFDGGSRGYRLVAEARMDGQ